MRIFQERVKYTDLNKLIDSLEKNSAELIELGKAVLDEMDLQQQRNDEPSISVRDVIQPADLSDRGDDVESNPEGINKQLYRKNQTLLDDLSKDYDRVQYVIHLLKFVARNNRIRNSKEYAVDRGILAFSLGDRSLSDGILKEVISIYKANEPVLRTSGTPQSNVERRYADMQPIKEAVENIESLVKYKNSLVNELSKHYKHRKVLTEVLMALAGAAVILGVVVLAIFGSTGGALFTAGFITILSGHFSGHLMILMRLRNLKDYLYTKEFLKLELKDNYNNFIDICKNTDRKQNLVDGLKYAHEERLNTSPALN